MSSLSQTINEDFIFCYKNHDDLKTSVLRLLKSAIKNREIELKAEPSDLDIVAILRREIKQRHDSIAQYQLGGREDLAHREQAEIGILEAYLPTQLSTLEIEALAKQTIADLSATGKSDFGRIMGVLMPKLQDKADGRVVSGILNTLLNNE